MIARYAGSGILAIAVTFGLFFAMQALIATGRNAIVDTGKEVRIEFHAQERDETPETIKQKLPDHPEVEKAPEVPKFEMARVNPGGASLNIAAPKLDASVNANFDIGDAPADGDIMPLVRVPAQYPRNAASRGIEGWVILEFDVTPEGTTENVHVIDSDPKNIFDRAAIRAVEKFKYKPKIVNGQPTKQFNVKFKYSFALADDDR